MSVTPRSSVHPRAVEAFSVGGEHVAAVGPLQMEHGRLRKTYAVSTLDDKKLIISAVDKVVQHSSIQPYLAVVA